MVYSNKYLFIQCITKVKTAETFVNISDIKFNWFYLIIALQGRYIAA